MFNMGGRIKQAQGTGITSGLDTPKRGLVDGPGGYAGLKSKEEIDAEVMALYPEKTAGEKAIDILKSYEVFNTGNTNDDGSAKTYGDYNKERLKNYNTQQAEEVATRNKAKLTLLQQDVAANVADELAANALERAKVTARTGMQNELPRSRQLSNGLENLSKAALEPTFPGRDFVLSGNAPNIVLGQVNILELQTRGEGSNAMMIPNTAYVRGPEVKDKKNRNAGAYDFVMANLSPNIVYWDSSRNKWVTIIQDSAGKKEAKFHNNYNTANASLTAEVSANSTSSSSSTKDIKVEKTDGIKTVSMHPVKVGSEEVTDAYVLQYIIDNNIITDNAEYRAIDDKENYTLMSLARVKVMLKNENKQKIKDEASDKKSYARLEKEAMNWFSRNYERLEKGTVMLPDRFEPFQDAYEKTLSVNVAQKLATGGRVGYALGSPRNQGEVITEEFEEISTAMPDVEKDDGADEMEELQSWWKSQIESDFNS